VIVVYAFKSMQLLTVNPEKTLVFNVEDLQAPCTTKLTLENSSDKYVAFKIKTTAPKSYLVRPSAGVVDPNGNQEVQIILQPLTTAPSEQCQDRFLVQACMVESAQTLSREAWTELQKDQVQDQRLSVQMDITDSKSSKRGGELQTKYEELTQFCVALEKQKKELEVENAALKRRGPAAGRVKQGFELWQVVLIVIVSLLGLRLIRLF